MLLVISVLGKRWFGLDVFRVLGNGNRRSMLKLLFTKEMHISAIARELNISVPVALRHAGFLEEAGFIERKRFGNSHVLAVKKEAVERLRQAWGLFEQPLVVEVAKGRTMLDALRSVPGIKISAAKDGHFISSVDGKEGYFVYEINGKFVEKSLEKIKIDGDLTVELKRLLPVVGKRFRVKVRA
jgi:DNA-binding transcriptional ArsR family regulator